jgi:gluconokinase
MSNPPQAIVLMGVSGCGKTSVGMELSRILGWSFFDGDDLHPPENIAKMAAGIPLDDDDRIPWLANLHDLIAHHLSEGQSILLACSALKKKYRHQLSEGNHSTVFVYLKGDFDLIFGRMQARPGHYMKADMLRSQFETFEEPEDAIWVNIEQNIEQITKRIIQELGLELMVVNKGTESRNGIGCE